MKRKRWCVWLGTLGQYLPRIFIREFGPETRRECVRFSRTLGPFSDKSRIQILPEGRKPKGSK